jgi:hypothetical protein
VPLGVALAVWLIPEPIMSEHRTAAALAAGRPTSKVAAGCFALIWFAAITLAGWYTWRYFSD